ncbi:MAG: hypothetical protein RRA92_01655 [Gemmatimonadota bacterium]|nr:hypothetical protein [Gemmatimonadota bacterium]
MRGRPAGPGRRASYARVVRPIRITVAAAAGLLLPVAPLTAQVTDTLPAPVTDTLPAPEGVQGEAPEQVQESPPSSGLAFGLGRIPFPWRVESRPRGPAEFRPWNLAGAWVGEEIRAVERGLEARRDTLWLAALRLDVLPPRFDRRRFYLTRQTVEGEDLPAPVARNEQQIDILPDALRGVADLDVQIDGTGQFKSQWQTFSPCTIGTGQQCNSTAVPDIAPEFQIRAIARGTISERVHVDVDFDQTREFDATNNINVFYEGKPDEIVSFVELGQVSLPLPRSQFISQAIPAGNFGMRGDARFGPLTLRGVFAQQEGNVQNRNVTLDVGGSGGEEGILQDVETILDDAGFASGQFFFVLDPRDLPDYPLVDVINLQGAEAPDALRPVSSIKLYRHEITAGQPQNVESGVIQARAVAARPAAADPALPDSAVFSGFFRPLVEGEDFIVHRSGLWVVLRSRVLRDEALAVAYVSATGDSIGDFDAEEKFRQFANTGTGELPRLVLLKDPATHRPGGVTWEREMHQIYRISSSDDVEAGSVRLVISQGPVESGPVVRAVEGEEFSFLEIFGLDDAPRDDVVDDARIWRPAASGEFAGTNVVSGSYLVFPALEPFKEPPPIVDGRVPALQGSPFPLAAGDRNLAIYEEPIDQIRTTSFLYRLNLEYRARSTRAAQSFSLGAIGIRQGSERVELNGRELVRGTDYSIDYEIGQLTLLRPAELTAGAQNPSLDVRFEQKPIFDIQQRSIFGLTGTWELGQLGAIEFVGLSQQEGSILNRPELGLEPGGVQLGGVMARLDFGSAALDRFANALPGIRSDVESRVRFDGEVAGSSPTTNRRGTTFVDDFEGTSRLRLGLSGRSWLFGSLPSSPELDGDFDFLPASPDATNRLSAVWQSQWLEAGLVRGPLLVRQIDPALRVLNANSTETVLWTTLRDPPGTGENGWASLTTVLSESGIDLTTSEFLEFYASTLGEEGERVAMIIDIGTVSEDAFVLDSLGLPAGAGVLDQEADPLVGVWGNPDDTGIWDQGCVATPSQTAYPLGDPLAVCTNQNGLEDSEDLNRDSFLNRDERFVRYVVPLNLPSRFLVRQTFGEFQFGLYRVPLRLPDHVVGGTLESQQQNVRHVRVTLVSDRQVTVLLSRMEFTGSSWLKRGGSGSVTGVAGDTPGTAGQVLVGPISTTDARYVSPPGIFNQAAQATDDLTLSSQTINEQSLRLSFTDIPAGERVEVFRRFSERPRDFLTYRRLRAWAVAVEGQFGATAPLRLTLRLGFDANNFYLYRAPLESAQGTVSQQSWLPEQLVDIERWIALRAEAERRLLESGAAIPADSSLVVWDVDLFPDADSTLAVVIGDRSRAPNLAAIRELAIGVENLGDAPVGAGEVWIDDLRLDQAADESGNALRGNLQIDLADVISLQGQASRRNPFYRQLGDSPPFESTSDASTRVSAKLGRFLPASLGLAIPFEYQYGRISNDPFFLSQTDVLAEEIPGLRTPLSTQKRLNLGLFKETPSQGWLARSTIDGLRLGYTWRSSDARATQTLAEGSGWNAVASWSRPVADASFPLLPGFLRAAIDGLPDFLSESSLLKNLRDLRFRWTPRDLRFGASLAKSTDRRFRFQSSVSREEDAAQTPAVDRQQILSPNAGIQLQPFPSVVWGLSFSSARDLVDPAFRVGGPQAVGILESESGSLLGFDTGWETSRSVRTNLSWQPDLASWFSPRFTLNTNYRSARNTSYLEPVAGDTTLLRDVAMDRDMALNVDVRPTDLADALGVPDGRRATGFWDGFREVWDRIQSVRVDWQRAVNTSFDRRDLDPSFGDQLVLSGFSSLRIVGADTASAAGDARRWSVRGGYRLPFDLDSEVNYSESENETLTPRSLRNSRDVDWPWVSLRWRSVPVPGALDDVVRNVSLTGTWRDRDRTITTTTGQDQGVRTLTRSVNVMMLFANGFNVSYQFDDSQTDRSDQTGSGESDRTGHSVRATGTVPAPGFLAFVKRPLRVSAEYSRNLNFDCRELGGAGFVSAIPGLGGDCTAHVDQTTQSAALTIDSDFEGYSLGVQLSWANRGSAVGRRQESNQFNLNIFGRFFLRSDSGALVDR